MNRTIFFALGLGLLGAAGGGKVDSEPAAAKRITFEEREILFAKWGKGPGEVPLESVEVKLRSGEIKTMYYGIAEFRIGDDGIMYLSDGSRILKYNLNGRYIRAFPLDFMVSDFTVNEDGDILAINTGAYREGAPRSPRGLTKVWDKRGRCLKEIVLELDEKMPGVYRPVYFEDMAVHDFKGKKLYQYGTGKSKKRELLATKIWGSGGGHGRARVKKQKRNYGKRVKSVGRF